MLKILSGCSMLAEIVRNSFTGRGDLSELCSHICPVAISSILVKSYNSSEERIIVCFERTKSNHDKLPRENNRLITTRQITLHIICINFQVMFFKNNFRKFGTLKVVFEEIIKLHIFIESRQEYFKKELICKRRCSGSLLSGFTRLVRVTQHDFL